MSERVSEEGRREGAAPCPAKATAVHGRAPAAHRASFGLPCAAVQRLKRFAKDTPVPHFRKQAQQARRAPPRARPPSAHRGRSARPRRALWNRLPE